MAFTPAAVSAHKPTEHTHTFICKTLTHKGFMKVLIFVVLNTYAQTHLSLEKS